MSTRSNIKIQDKWDTFHIYRGHDGHPENVMPDLQRVIEQKKQSWSGSEAELMVTSLLVILNDKEARLPTYTITSGKHGDEEYFYELRYEDDQWTAHQA